jgi:hypothetical protein
LLGGSKSIQSSPTKISILEYLMVQLHLTNINITKIVMFDIEKLLFKIISVKQANGDVEVTFPQSYSIERSLPIRRMISRITIYPCLLNNLFFKIVVIHLNKEYNDNCFANNL